ncbi:MAG: sporulation protein YqfD [Clostridia bacterium]|nr:sporulation protein YqfD [Clostridia bacterium]
MANFRPERFINRIITGGISVHNIRRMNRYAATMTVSHRDLPKALALSEEDGCEVEILRRGGLQLIAGFLRARLALAVGLELASAALIFLSHRLIAIRT